MPKHLPLLIKPLTSDFVILFMLTLYDPEIPLHLLFMRLIGPEMVEASLQEEWLPYKMENRYSIWQRRFILRKKDGLISIK